MHGRQSTDYDLIIIGSGMGGLTVASLMSQLRNLRVLVIERHFQPGGYTHDFKRGKFQFNTGLHYLGWLEEGSQSRRLFDLITKGQVDWRRIPDPFERFTYPGFSLEVTGDLQKYRKSLMDKFPHAAGAIKSYFRDVRKVGAGMAMLMMKRNASRFIRFMTMLARGVLRPRPDRTTKAYMDARFKDPLLKAVLCSQWLDFGLPPGRSPFALHALVVGYYLKGGYVPIGGSGTIAESVKKIVEAHGGRFLLKREAKEVLIKDGRAVGVRASRPGAEGDFADHFAPVVVSNAGAVTTYLKLIPSDQVIPFRNDLKRFIEAAPPAANVSLFLGLKESPAKLGFGGENNWIYAGLDHDAVYERRGRWLENGEPEQVFLSFPSLKDPTSQGHSAEVLSITDYAFFSRWRDQPWGKRDQEYQAAKQRIADAMIAFVDRTNAGFADLIEFSELGTPLTTEHFTGHYQGAMYGLPSLSERFLPANLSWTHPRTPIPGLYMAGADTAGLGVMGAAMGGLLCLGHLPEGVSMFEVMRTARRGKPVPA